MYNGDSLDYVIEKFKDSISKKVKYAVYYGGKCVYTFVNINKTPDECIEIIKERYDTNKHTLRIYALEKEVKKLVYTSYTDPNEGKCIKDLTTRIIYETIKDCAEGTRLKPITIRAQLSGWSKSKLRFVFVSK